LPELLDIMRPVFGVQPDGVQHRLLGLRGNIRINLSHTQRRLLFGLNIPGFGVWWGLVG